MEKNTTTPTEKSKKKVSFGRTKVRLVFDYPNENFTQDEDTDERTSQELTRMKEIQTQLQKQPKKPILKSTVRSGPNTLKGRTKHMLEWDKMDRNFWVPAKQTRKGRRRDNSPSEGDAGLSFAKREESLHNVKEDSSTSNKTTISNKDEKTVDKDEDSSVGAVLSKKATNIDEKLEVKNNQKWRGVVGDHKYELNKFVGVYKGVEADLEQTRQSLLKIGVDVSEDELQNPRDFVTIMNMLLCVQQDESDKQTSAKSQRDLAEQHPAFPQDLDTISTRKEVPDEPPNSHGSFKVEEKSIPNSRVSGSNEEDLIIKEELMNDELSSTHNEKLQNRKSSKRFRMKGFLPRKKGKTDGKMTRGDKKDSEDYLSFSPSIGSEKNMDSKECSSSDKFRSLKDRSSLNASHSQRPQRSQSEDNLDHFGKTKKQQTRKTNDSKSMDDINSDMECSTGSRLYRERAFSDNNLNLPRRVSVDHDLTQDVLHPSARDRGSSVIEAKFQESKNRDRPKIVKRDSWFLTKNRRSELNTWKDPKKDQIPKRNAQPTQACTESVPLVIIT
ncbi:uncharacterized protein LOC114520475 [Dendronephthya gigantea]|uniref:uncharacterized protein LOC114520475 n=1 Tax=Dendronephthya gigantea TaxID=151771 RepID=UPI00106D96E6|nr:uncharacterized protein LOC114520475 [Dendronephthya gigantea]